MKNEFVPYELALKLKKIRFEDECMACFEMSLTEVEHEEDGKSGPFGWKKGELFFEKTFFINNNSVIDNSNENWIRFAAPTFSQAFRWFREKHNLCMVIKPIDDKNLDVGYALTKNELIIRAYTTYEKAELGCLEKLIEIVGYKLE